MTKNINRRDFLKLTSLIASAGIPLRVRIPDHPGSKEDMPNILVVVFDAFSAYNVSLYGYPRLTTPMLSELAQRAIVYHNHYAGGPFTTPGTTSLVTGMLPWTHRAVNANNWVVKELRNRNIFNLLGEGHYSIAYTHNPQADRILKQFLPMMDEYIPRQDLYLRDYWVSDKFANDFDMAFIAVHSAIEDFQRKVTNSLYFPLIYEWYEKSKREEVIAPYVDDFPRGLPQLSGVSGQYFLLEQGVDWLAAHKQDLPQPFFGYFHFLPPHDPYNTRKDFVHLFLENDYSPPEKPEHILSSGEKRWKMMEKQRYYDEYINYVDAEFERLFAALSAQGQLDNTWLIMTSDHGEMFERGFSKHLGNTLHQPVVHIPLMIFPPGQTERVDVYHTTSAIDMLPTLLHIAGYEVPDWCEGRVLPPFGGSDGMDERAVFSLQARENTPFKPFEHAVAMMIKGRYKMLYFYGFPEFGEEHELVEMYDLEKDPEEMNNLYSLDWDIAQQMRQEILDRLAKENEPYS